MLEDADAALGLLSDGQRLISDVKQKCVCCVANVALRLLRCERCVANVALRTLRCERCAANVTRAFVVFTLAADDDAPALSK
jgi:predicted amidophosphoribosyltransferase